MFFFCSFKNLYVKLAHTTQRQHTDYFHSNKYAFIDFQVKGFFISFGNRLLIPKIFLNLFFTFCILFHFALPVGCISIFRTWCFSSRHKMCCYFCSYLTEFFAFNPISPIWNALQTPEKRPTHKCIECI